MDRQALVLRNQAMAKAYHHLPVKHRIRRALLHALGTVPIPNAKSPTDERILLNRPDLYDKESDRAGEADFDVAKHRNGPTKTIKVVFQGHYSRFADMQL